MAEVSDMMQGPGKYPYGITGVHRNRPTRCMLGYRKRWVITDTVCRTEFEYPVIRVWFTTVYDLYTFSVLHQPKKNRPETTLSKGGYLLSVLQRGNIRRPFEECVLAFAIILSKPTS